MVLQLLDIVRRNGERFEYAHAMFIGEFGLLLTAGQLVSYEPLRLAIAAAVSISMMTTAIVWVRLFRAFRERDRGRQ